jgi:hypothetical protein
MAKDILSKAKGSHKNFADTANEGTPLLKYKECLKDYADDLRDGKDDYKKNQALQCLARIIGEQIKESKNNYVDEKAVDPSDGFRQEMGQAVDRCVKETCQNLKMVSAEEAKKDLKSGSGETYYKSKITKEGDVFFVQMIYDKNSDALVETGDPISCEEFFAKYGPEDPSGTFFGDGGIFSRAVAKIRDGASYIFDSHDEEKKKEEKKWVEMQEMGTVQNSPSDEDESDRDTIERIPIIENENDKTTIKSVKVNPDDIIA